MSIRSSWVGRTFRAMPFLVHAGLAASLGISATGCGALSALTNPKAAWALDESAPMSVVMRRAEVANATAKQVDRLMGETRDQLATDLKAMARREAVKASALGSTLKEALETDLKHATRLFTPEEPMVRPVRH